MEMSQIPTAVASWLPPWQAFRALIASNIHISWYPVSVQSLVAVMRGVGYFAYGGLEGGEPLHCGQAVIEHPALLVLLASEELSKSFCCLKNSKQFAVTHLHPRCQRDCDLSWRAVTVLALDEDSCAHLL
jgi:hypothetical protein